MSHQTVELLFATVISIGMLYASGFVHLIIALALGVTCKSYKDAARLTTLIVATLFLLAMLILGGLELFFGAPKLVILDESTVIKFIQFSFTPALLTYAVISIIYTIKKLIQKKHAPQETIISKQ